ncbi:MAG: alcohol dehydrogenase catalytic domain-containing protein [Acidobacteria bacterium]|nr:alcohol dehydrogenase catalytic domain-containing protein [Acidobacteriota bacterium]
MKAITFQSVERLRFETVDDPGIEQAGDVIVRVLSAGICGSDLHVYHGRETGLDAGTIMGHEFVGEVVEVAAGVELWSAGDVVVSPFTTNCGKCRQCVAGLTSRCRQGQLFGWVENGTGLHGCHAELVRVPLADSTLVRVPEGATLEAALFAGDILATGYFGAESAGVCPGCEVAVVGCGPVGLMAILSAREFGAERVLAVDRLPERLDLAASLGAVPVPLEGDELAALTEAAASGRGVDAVVEAVGSSTATRLAVDLVRPGGTISAVGVHTEEHLAFSPGEAYDKNLTYRAGRCPVRHYMDRVLPLAVRKSAELTALVSHRLPLSEGIRGYDLFARRVEGCTKVVLLPG